MQEMGKLIKLENLSLKHNQLEKLFGELTELACLRSLNLRHNDIKCSGIPTELFDLDGLTTIDLSYNKLKAVPDGLNKARSLLVLNLSHNQCRKVLVQESLKPKRWDESLEKPPLDHSEIFEEDDR